MQRCLLLVFGILLMVSLGCQDAPKSDPEFKKEKAEKPPATKVRNTGRAATRSNADL